MKGCVRRRGKAWTVRIYRGRNPETKQTKWLHKSFKTEREAQAFKRAPSPK
jgi:endonuclease YncB( thermonuclease family)